MKVLFFAYGNNKIASSRTRVFQYFPYFNQKKIKTSFLVYTPEYSNFRSRFLTSFVFRILVYFKLFYFHLRSLTTKIIFIQKLYLPIFYVNILSLIGKIIIYDFDDAIYTNDLNQNINSKTLIRFNHCLKVAKLVIVENENTENYVNTFNPNTLKITGPIECNRYFPSHLVHDKVTIGWIGSPSTTKYLLIISEALKEIELKFSGRVNFITIGASKININGVNITNYNWNLESEVDLLQKIDIGIMPLPDDQWSRGKGGYKLLQYMAIGIPSVASPVGINSELIIENVNGFLAIETEEWVDKISNLITDKELRTQIGNNARVHVEENYSFEHYSEILIDKLKSF